ncbi:hypothetical protein D3C85_1316250 [compost metagenome]
MLLYDLENRFAADGHMGPGDELGLAVFAERIPVDTAWIDGEHLRQQRLQAGGVNRGSGADHSVAGQARNFPYHIGDNINRISGNHEDAIESSGHYFGNNILGDNRRSIKNIQSALSRLGIGACCQNDNVHSGAIAGGAGIYLGACSGEIHAVREIKRLCHGAVISSVNHHDFIAYCLIDHGIGTAGTDHSRADDRHFS